MAYFTRSRARSEHKAAGVLPFSLHEGAVVVLLGGEPCKTGPKVRAGCCPVMLLFKRWAPPQRSLHQR